MMKGLYTSSASIHKSKRTNDVRTERNTTSFLQHAEMSTNLSVQQMSKQEEYKGKGELKRLRAAAEKIQKAEIRATEAQQENKMNHLEVDQLLNTYLEQLQSTIVLANGKSSSYTDDLKGFVDNCCVGITKASKQRQRLLEEQVEIFAKHKENDKSLHHRKDLKLQDMKL